MRVIDSYQLFFHPIKRRWAIKIHIEAAPKADVIDNLTAEEFSALVAILESGSTAVDNQGWILGKIKVTNPKALVPERLQPFEPFE